MYRWIDYFEIEYSNFAAVFLAILVYNWGYGNVQYWLTAGDEDNQKITELIPFEKFNTTKMWCGGMYGRKIFWRRCII